MTVYLLIEKKSGEVVGVYKYSSVALIEANREGINTVFNGLFGKKTNGYRVEVRKLIE